MPIAVIRSESLDAKRSNRQAKEKACLYATSVKLLAVELQTVR